MKVLFVCVGNSCRSQMAEGLFRALASGEHQAWSAGTHPASRVSPGAVQALAERGIDISHQRPKGLAEAPPDVELAVALCEDSCPQVRAGRREHWPTPDPIGGSLDEYRAVRDQIEARIRDLLERLR
jgi:arsenate reductase (thioredoxin)